MKRSRQPLSAEALRKHAVTRRPLDTTAISTKPSFATNPQGKNLTIKCEPGFEERAIAETAMDPITRNAVAAEEYSRHFGDVDLGEIISLLKRRANVVHGGDIAEAETVLTAQANTLDTIFTSFARAAAFNVPRSHEATEVYLRLALKAQSQCRTTLEVLAAIKRPPLVIARQANIAHGHQQVNNGSRKSPKKKSARRTIGNK